MNLNFVTLFYANYSAKGIALCRSIERVSPKSHLYVFAMDEVCFKILKSIELKNTTIISLAELERFFPDLLSVKSSRNKGEYSWTCKGPALLYCFEKFGLSDCTYVDADMYFFSAPSPLYIENPEADVMLTDHRYTEGYNLAETNGKYCAGYMYFKSTPNGINVLRHWTRQCIDWCYGRHEPGRFGDQKYLDFFHDDWDNIYDIQHIGICAPWNIQQYIVELEDNKVKVKLGGRKDDLIFYHFHFLKNQDFGKYNELYLGPYLLNKVTYEYIYESYLNEVKDITKYVDGLFPGNDALASNLIPMSWLRLVLHCMKNICNRNKRIWKRR